MTLFGTQQDGTPGTAGVFFPAPGVANAGQNGPFQMGDPAPPIPVPDPSSADYVATQPAGDFGGFGFGAEVVTNGDPVGVPFGAGTLDVDGGFADGIAAAEAQAAADAQAVADAQAADDLLATLDAGEDDPEDPPPPPGEAARRGITAAKLLLWGVLALGGMVVLSKMKKKPVRRTTARKRTIARR